MRPPSENLDFDVLEYTKESVKSLKNGILRWKTLKPVHSPTVTFDNIEIFRDDGRAMACLIFTEEIGDMETVPTNNFTADNVVFKNITYNAAMKNKISAANETNTINVTVENCNFRKLNSSKNSKLMFETDEFANVTYK